MANVSVYNMEGNEVGKMELNDAVFGVEINEHLVHMAVVAQLANKRQGTQKAKTRSEVSGGGRKPWRQKGTGHARQGSTRAPQWTGGGIVFAPTPRDYTITLNKKEKRAALKSALTSRVQENKFIVVCSPQGRGKEMGNWPFSPWRNESWEKVSTSKKSLSISQAFPILNKL